MKQGQASREVTAQKVEPKPNAKNPACVAGIGVQEVWYRKPDDPGGGYSAPMVSQKTSKSGSQGKY